MTNEPSHRRSFAIGLLIALLVGLGIEYWLFVQSRVLERQNLSERQGIIAVLSLAKIVEESGDSTENVRNAVATAVKQNDTIRQVRVIRRTTLEISTLAGDTGDKAAPRRLSREEKPLFDLGQRLRSAVLTNQEEGVSRKNEIEIAPAASGGLILSAPIEQDGSVVGFVQVETASLPPSPRASWFIPVLILIVAILIFLVLGKWIGERRALLAPVSFILLFASIGWYGAQLYESVKQDRLNTEKTVAAMIKSETGRIVAAISSIGMEPSQVPDASSLDTDVFRRPRGFISGTGEIQVQKLDQSMQTTAGQLFKIIVGITIFASLILAFFGFGFASRLALTAKKYREAYTYTAPAMIGMLVLVFFPFFYGITLSFTGSTLYNTDKPLSDIWVGLKNYQEILGDFSLVKRTSDGLSFNYQNFYYTFLFTILWTVSNVTIGVVVGLILALILNTKGLALRPLYRVLLIFPWAMPNYITALIWKGMFHQQFGVINQVIQMFGGDPISWFEKPFTSFLTALATNGWLSFPFMMVVSLGALQSIPGDLYEAARVDGASRWQQFRSITLPSLRPALVPAIILSVVWTFNMFNIIYLVTAGEPAGSTEILITQAYKIAFQQYRYGYAAAYSTVIFLILLVYGTVQNKLAKATEAVT